MKLRLRASPVAGLSVIGSVLVRNIDNAISGGTIDSAVVSGFASYDIGRLSLFGNYSRQELTDEIANRVTTPASDPSLTRQ